MTYPAARLTARWQGRQVGTLVIGSNAEHVIRAGIATRVVLEPSRIFTTTTPHDGGHDGQDRTADQEASRKDARTG